MKWLLGLVVILIVSACDWINPEEPLPDYVVIPDITLTTNYLAEGSASEKIVDAWVYIDNNPIGVFELPARFPIIEGSGTLQIVPGILERGISNTREPYPFYQGYSYSYSYDPATDDTIYPSILYRDDTNFPLKEDFESGNEFSGMTVTGATSEVFEGDKSGVVRMDSDNDTLLAFSTGYQLPGGGTRVYLEMDYRNDIPFNILLQGNRQQGNATLEYLITVNPQSAWNKMYIDVTNITSGLNANNYQLVFATSLPDTLPSANLYWDNVKIVHF